MGTNGSVWSVSELKSFSSPRRPARRRPGRAAVARTRCCASVSRRRTASSRMMPWRGRSRGRAPCATRADTRPTRGHAGQQRRRRQTRPVSTSIASVSQRAQNMKSSLTRMSSPTLGLCAFVVGSPVYRVMTPRVPTFPCARHTLLFSPRAPISRDTNGRQRLLDLCDAPDGEEHRKR